MDSFRKARKQLLRLSKKELIGPGYGERCDESKEIITENPISRYTVGILYPQNANRDLKEEIDDTGANEVGSKEDLNSFLDNHINIANQYYPSAMGLSFYISGINPGIKVNINSARYVKTVLDDCAIETTNIPEEFIDDEKFNSIFKISKNRLIPRKKISRDERDRLVKRIKKNYGQNSEFESLIYKIYSRQEYGWKREPIEKTIIFNKKDKNRETKKITDGLKIECIKRPINKSDRTLFTVSLINNNTVKEKNVRKNKKSFFQCGFTVNSLKKDFCEYNNDNFSAMSEEEKTLALLYRNKKSYAVGHGCAADWEEETNKIKKISTSIIPEEEIPEVEYLPDELKNKNLEILKLINISDLSELTLKEQISGLNEFCNIYNEWIISLEKRKTKVPEDLTDIADKHIEKCKETLRRMKKGIKLIGTNKKIRTAFLFANKAMLMQMENSKLKKRNCFPGEEKIEWPDYNDSQVGWRPFQLAFILLSIEGISDPESRDRDFVDLIWFPTGGGKTEAYLGLIAFTIFLRRLRYPVKGSGTAIIMRYTLRLLTAQQFQRASTLICACELIRRENTELGDKKISLGLWIGKNSTPNYLDKAFREIDFLAQGRSKNNKFQILKCPWCGTKMEAEDGKGEWGYRRGRRPERLIIYCPEEKCDFNIDKELPIKVVDEDIYKDPPTLLFGTVDKFAMMPWKTEISNLFALDEGNNNLSPELIIQDELHLISGPLGTIVGLYETAIDALCSEKGINPKIVASTATIRRAINQCKSLYNRDMRQFPPPGLEKDDSFFAREIPIDERPGRLYAGIMSSGKTQTTTEIRLMASLLQLCKKLDYEDEIIDKYWTLTGYFNSLRELGRCSTMVSDDIKDHVKRIAKRENIDERKIFRAKELTGRKKAGEIPWILEKLEAKYPDDNPINILLATNMISVGIDISRLGLMIMVGQPKTTSEYIQATSRVGRKFPGLIFTLYDGARYRDRSHYEDFISYHQSFYRYVEPTSVTPFSGAARQRGLHAVFITYLRHILGLRKDNQIKDFISGIEELELIKTDILNRVKKISIDELADTEKEIEKLIEDLENIVNEKDNITYSNQHKAHLIYPYSKENDNYWKTLQSMRNVDQACKIHILD